MVLGDVHVELGMHGLAVEVHYTFPQWIKISGCHRKSSRMVASSRNDIWMRMVNIQMPFQAFQGPKFEVPTCTYRI